jgi:amino acid adenylation domain-containing protein
LDPDYPPERLSYMLLDTDPLVVLSETGTKSVVPVTNASIIDIKGDWANIAKMSESSPESSARAGNAAYIIYTSGSTGRPKGVVTEHGSVSNLIRAQRETFAPGESDRILQFFSFSFDVSIFAILMALGSGARLVLATREDLLPGSALVELLESESITLAVMPPLVLSHMPDAELPALRKIILGGEAWGEELMKRWGKGRRFFNSYGPTETTVQAAVGEYRLGAGRPSIGRPINNARIYLLDLEGNPVPVGVAGELYIGGDGLGRGYLDCALTAAKFVPDPFSEIPGKRLYRTGDWARWLPDGNIDLLGRKDGQIKLRGFRVELGEIESVLSEHLLVRQCAIVALQEKRNAENRLVAYVTLVGGKSPAEKELRNYLKEKLPDYMVPAQFMILEEFPLNHSGKIDRTRLPAPHAESSASERGSRTPEEEILCGLFAEVLERECVSVDDNFFDLGGHSLKATRLASRIRAVLGRELSLSAVFESPTVSGLAHHLRHAAGIVVPLHSQDHPGDLPLSYGQQRLWFIDQLQGKSSEYNIVDALHLRGPLDCAALQRSINMIIARHEVMRTHFVEKNGTPVQIIESELLIPILVDDLSGAGEMDRQKLIQRTVQQESKHCFDLAQGPLLRIRLLRIAEQEHILLRTCHHIITDGWSQAIFNTELMSLYEAFHLNQDVQLPPISLQYADYALWQRKTLDSTLTAQLAYWKEKLRGAPQELALPMDRPRPERQTFAADGHTTLLNTDLVTALKKLGRSNQATLYMTLLAAFAVLLERYSGQQDIVVGSPIANRQEEQLEALMGFFVNSLVMRIGVDGLESFSALLSQVRKTALAAYMHQDLPFERLVEELSPQRSLNKTPIYQVMFALQNTPQETMRLKDLELKRVPAEQLQTLFDLELFAFEREEEIRLFWVYNRDLFDRWRIEQMAHHYTRLLHAVVADPSTPLSFIAMLDDREKQKLLMEWNSTARQYPAQDTVAMLFEQQMARTPHATAVICGEQSITYNQLNDRANQLGNYLRELGVGPEVLVGVCLQRNLQMLVGLLGVLKAGGAYVPLDPKYPIERLSYMLEDSQAPVLLTEQALLPQLPRFTGTVVTLDDQWSDMAGRSTQNLKNTGHPENLAYVIYTSGSTGKPKGVTVSQGSAATLCHWSHEVFPANDLAGVLFSTSICFDISVFEMFVPLTCGGAVLVVENVLELAGMANAEQVTLVNTVPSALRELVYTRKIPSSVRTINSAGEALDSTLVQDIYQTTEVQRIFNLYGPSEDTVFSTYISVPRSHDDKPPAIGRPIANTQAYVVDEEMQPRPVGVVGELLLGGAGLARGYLNRPELTAERFIPDPFSSKQGGRLYRTGDLVRWAASGDIEFVGRADNQVKIRGFRIELGEIEAVLRQVQGIDQAIVVAHEESGEKRLAAYIVIREGEQSLTAAMLRGHLKTKLPEHMIPSYFVILDQLPQTQNGKIDRRALPKPQAISTDVYSAPGSLLEQKIAKVWQDALAVERVGLDDNFFDLGAHSLLVARIRFILCEELKRNISILDFFTYPTVRSLAHHLNQAQEEPVNVTESQQRALRQKTNMLRRRQEFRARTDKQETV